jgi:hypothetical protein
MRISWEFAVSWFMAWPLAVFNIQSYSQFNTTENDSSMIIKWSGENPWEAVVDQKHGGVISYLALGDGGNIVATHKNEHSGLCNLYYATRDARNPKLGEGDLHRKVAIGHIWGNMLGMTEVEMVSGSENEVKIKVKGGNSGWQLISPRREKVVEFETFYTFRQGRIECEETINWVYPYDTWMTLMSIEHYFNPGFVGYPPYLLEKGKDPIELPVTSSHGEYFPEVASGEKTVRIELTNGYYASFNMLESPPALEHSNRYKLERPKGIHIFGFCTDEESVTRVSYCNPIHYKYSIEFERYTADQKSPTIRVYSPARDAVFDKGDTIVLSAAAFDGHGRPIRGENMEWVIRYKWNNIMQKSNGAVIEHILPGTVDELPGIIWTEIKVADESGKISYDYIRSFTETYKIIQ